MVAGMEALNLGQQRTVSAFLEELYAVRDLAGYQTHILAALPRLVPADTISYNEVNPQARRNAFVSTPAVPSEYQPAFLRHMREHPLIAHYVRTRDGRSLRISDCLSEREFHRLAIYDEFFRPQRSEYQVAINLPAPSPLVVVGIALRRGLRDFSPREMQLLNLLRPHLIQAYRNAELVTRIYEEQTLLRQTLDGLPYGIIVLTREGRARLTNARAMQVLVDYWGGSLRGGNRLPEEMERWVMHETAAAAGTRSLGHPRAPLVLERGERYLVVRFAGRDARVLLLEEQVTVLSPRTLLPLGLTRREADVMTWIVQGKTNAEIATILGTSPYTVIKHLQHIFEKLGVKTRTAAAARVLKSLIVPAR